MLLPVYLAAHMRIATGSWALPGAFICCGDGNLGLLCSTGVVGAETARRVDGADSNCGPVVTGLVLSDWVAETGLGRGREVPSMASLSCWKMADVVRACTS